MTSILRNNPNYPGLDEAGMREALTAGLADRPDRIEPPTEAQRERVLGCGDEATLDGWIARVLDARTLEDVLGEG